jgi:CBS domain containing-hemolysin-like protein
MRALGRAALDNPNWKVGQVAWHPMKLHAKDKLNHAFSKLQSLGRQIAIVVDDNEKFIGLITIEDLIGELIGERK